MSSNQDNNKNRKNGVCQWVEYKSSSGSKYYINSVTKEKIYEKPLELASPSERVEILEKREKQKKFFAEMEENISIKLTSASSACTKSDLDVAESKSSHGTMGGSISDSKTSGTATGSSIHAAAAIDNFFDFSKSEARWGIAGSIGVGGGGGPME